MKCPRGKELNLTCGSGYLHCAGWAEKNNCEEANLKGDALPICNCSWAQVIHAFSSAKYLRGVEK